MATIRVKRGTTKPTTANLTVVGELAFDYTNNVLYARNSTAVVKIGGEMELVYSYEGAAYLLSVMYGFSSDYIYKVHIISTTQGTTVDSSTTILNYRTSSYVALYGSNSSIASNDAGTTITKATTRNTATFTIPDAHSSGTTLTSGIAKVIDFELSPTFATALTDTQQWVASGKAVTTVTGQGDATITVVDFVHSFYGAFGNIYINTGLNLGSPDLLSVSVYRIKRK